MLSQALKKIGKAAHVALRRVNAFHQKRAAIASAPLYSKNVPRTIISYCNIGPSRPVCRSIMTPILHQQQENNDEEPNFVCLSSETTLTLKINGLELPFPLPDKGIYYVSYWCGSDQPAPFLNREKLLFEFLNSAFKSWYRTTPKPHYPVQTMHPGSGKTRLQVEWIYHALNTPEVVNKFLAEEIYWEDAKKKFINVLYESAFTQRIILANGSNLRLEITNKKPDYSFTIKHMIRSAISTRFWDKIDSDLDKTLSIDYPLECHLKLFNELIDQHCLQPKTLPFENVRPGNNFGDRYFIFGIDHCRHFSEKYCDAVEKEDPLYGLLGYANDNLSGTFWLATGTITPGKFDRQAKRRLIISGAGSLDSLLNIKCLEQICQQYLNKSLTTELLNQNKKTLALHNETAKILVGLFYRTCGMPRAIEKLLQSSLGPIKQIEELLSSNGTPGSTKNIEEFQNTAHEQTSKLLGNHQFISVDMTQDMKGALHSPRLGEAAKKAIELLDIKAALCLKQNIREIIQPFGVAAQHLEQEGYLLQWQKNDEEEKCYTRPFFLTNKNVTEELESLKYKAKSSDHWQPLKISIATLTLHQNVGEFVVPNHRGVKIGALFGQHLAASLYARYVLHKLEKKPMEVIYLQDILQDTKFPKTEINWQGVAVLNQSIPIEQISINVLEECNQKRVILVNVHGGVADVLCPVTIDGHFKFICFHADEKDLMATHVPDLQKKVAGTLKVVQNTNFLYCAMTQPPLGFGAFKAAVHMEMIRTKEVEYSYELLKHVYDIESVGTIEPEMKKALKILLAQEEKQLKAKMDNVFTMPVSAIASPIYLSYYSFAPIFEGNDLSK